VSLASYAWRPVVLNVWASWCGGCIHEAPTLRSFTRAHPRVAVLGINTLDSKAQARAFTRRFGLGFPSIFHPHGGLFVRLHSPGLPATLFLDRRHRIVFGIAGAATRAQLEAGLRAARRTA
jgi:thiol-disulfide isomerase/thioredoxin